MTNEEIAKFIARRAESNGKDVHMSDAKLVVVKVGRNLMFGVKFGSYNDPFIVRFTRNGVLGIFKIPRDIDAISNWYAAANASMKDMGYLEYDIDHVPNEVQAIVTNAVVSALKTKGMGLDCFSPSISSDINLVSTNESYEEVVIENDLMTDEDFLPNL